MWSEAGSHDFSPCRFPGVVSLLVPCLLDLFDDVVCLDRRELVTDRCVMVALLSFDPTEAIVRPDRSERYEPSVAFLTFVRLARL